MGENEKNLRHGWNILKKSLRITLPIFLIVACSAPPLESPLNPDGSVKETIPPPEQNTDTTIIDQSKFLTATPDLNDLSYIAEVVPADDPLNLGRECRGISAVYTLTNQFVVVIVDEFGNYGPVEVYVGSNKVGGYNPSTEPLPTNLLGVSPDNLTVCKS